MPLPTRRYSSRYDPPRARTRLQKALDAATVAVIREVFAETGGDRTSAAESLGVSVRHLYRELTRLGLTAEDVAPRPGLAKGAES